MSKVISFNKVETNSRRIWAIICVLGAFIVAFYKVSVEIYNFKDLPATVKEKAKQRDVDALTLRIKTLEKDSDKLKSLPDKVKSIEERQSALELQITAGFSKIEAKLDQVQMTQNIINTQIVKNGLEHKK